MSTSSSPISVLAAVAAEASERPAWPAIQKSVAGAARANLADYDQERAHFSWRHLQAQWTEGVNEEMNLATLAIDRPAALAPDKVALCFVDAHHEVVEQTYGQVLHDANRFANLLRNYDVPRGAVVAAMLGRCPELFSAVLGTCKAGAIFTSLFTAFGPEPIRSRLQLADAWVLVTTQRLYERKVAPIRDGLPILRHVFVIRDDPTAPLPAGTEDFTQAFAAASDDFETLAVNPDDPALLHFTSGTTGKPKGVLHAHRAALAHRASAELALDLHPHDTFWCTADPGWVTGISYGVIAPLACGASLLIDREEFDAERGYRLLAEHKVSVWYTTPTAIRMLMKAGLEPPRRHSYPALRLIASVGEPLNPDAVMWGVEAFGLPVHDTWWQTETGAIMIANFLSSTVWPGSMGRPIPGVEIRIARRRGNAVELLGPDEVGEIALRTGWPSMFQSYLNDEDRYRKNFVDGWYFSGDQARCDARGYFWFVGRSDDVIKSAGHLISPVEVENALNRHPAVMQAAVIGLPDPVMGQIVHAVVELKPGQPAVDDQRRSIVAHGHRLLGAAIAPHNVEFTPALPRTRSGKIMRRLLRARALGLPEGDLSTLGPGA